MIEAIYVAPPTLCGALRAKALAQALGTEERRSRLVLAFILVLYSRLHRLKRLLLGIYENQEATTARQVLLAI